ncbi:alcohol dehydrogenase catalytic domain-containing protein [Stappia sp. GBMRC 2046]|uniref:Alcohol dehydrogenase catalytic domain-containing protein n=1 Tax=Stappia sediminis TaxID=2692190 RepID=A0A7X3SA35_9HYPH|nr:alcohol dehydrogenase catalytic domain-containing protein [Stappia sediminis]MXN67499.1 alcohol dehydrogenase catalytic domain-containing protein [Stappia sediminis]
MKALVYTGPKSLEFRDVPEPVAEAGTTLIRIESVGICGSDMHAYLGHDERRPAPLILGHEAAGTVVSGADAGRRVTINPLVTCMECSACRSGRENLCARRQIISMPPREGAFAQFVAMPERNLVTVPDGISFDKAALAEPIACGWHAAKMAERALVPALDDVATLVIGGGAIGVGAALSLKALGVRDITIVEPNALRRRFLTEKIGLNACDRDRLASERTFGLVIDAVGMSGSRADASERAAPGGVIVHIGLGEAAGGLNIRRVTLQEITFIGTYTYTMADFHETAEAIFDGRLGPLDWAEIRPLGEGAKAFSDLLSGAVNSPKIILRPHQD